MKRCLLIFLGIYFITFYNSVFSQSLIKENILYSEITIELWSGKKLEGKVVEMSPNFIVISETTLHILKNKRKILISDIKKIYDKNNNVIYETNEKLENIAGVKKRTDTAVILSVISGIVCVTELYRYWDKKNSAKDFKETDKELSEKYDKDANKDLIIGIAFGGASILSYILLKNDEVEVPKSNLSIKANFNKISLSYKF